MNRWSGRPLTDPFSTDFRLGLQLLCQASIDHLHLDFPKRRCLTSLEAKARKTGCLGTRLRIMVGMLPRDSLPCFHRRRCLGHRNFIKGACRTPWTGVVIRTGVLGDLAPMCIRMCCCRTTALVNFFWQMGQECWTLERGHSSMDAVVGLQVPSW